MSLGRRVMVCSWQKRRRGQRGREWRGWLGLVWTLLWALGWVLGLGWSSEAAAGQVLTTAVFRGRVVQAGRAPLPAVGLVLWPAPENESAGRAVSGFRGAAPQRAPSISTGVGRGGDFSVLGLQPGLYRGELLLRGGLAVALPGIVQVEAGETVEVEIRFQPDGSPPDKTGVPVLTMRRVGASSDVASESGLVAPLPQTSGALRGRSKGTAGSGGESALDGLPLEDRQWEAVEATDAAAHEATLADAGRRRMLRRTTRPQRGRSGRRDRRLRG